MKPRGLLYLVGSVSWMAGVWYYTGGIADVGLGQFALYVNLGIALIGLAIGWFNLDAKESDIVAELGWWVGLGLLVAVLALGLVSLTPIVLGLSDPVFKNKLYLGLLGGGTAVGVFLFLLDRGHRWRKRQGTPQAKNCKATATVPPESETTGKTCEPDSLTQPDKTFDFSAAVFGFIAGFVCMVPTLPALDAATDGLRGDVVGSSEWGYGIRQYDDEVNVLLGVIFAGLALALFVLFCVIKIRPIDVWKGVSLGACVFGVAASALCFTVH